MAVLTVLQAVCSLCRDGLTVFDRLGARAQTRRARVADLCVQIADSLWRLQEALEFDPGAPSAQSAIAREEGRLSGYAEQLVEALTAQIGPARAARLHERLDAVLKSHRCARSGINGSATARALASAHLRLARNEGYFRAVADRIRL